MPVKIPPRRGVKKQWPAVTVVNPGKGLNNVISDEYIAPEEASSLQDVKFVEAGNPAKRNGYTAVGTGLTSNPKGLGSYYATISGVRTPYLLTIDGTDLKYLNSSTWTAISGATFTADKDITFSQARGELYIWNGTEAGTKLNSSLTLSRPTTTIRASFSIFYNGKQVASGVNTQPSRLYISNANAADDFTVATGGTAPQPDNSTDAPGATVFAGTPSSSEANVVDVSKDDGDKITGLAKFQEKLVIFKERSIWSMTFDSAGIPVIVQVSSSIGCVSHRSIDNVENDVIFLSRNGYYTLGNQEGYIGTVIRTNELSARIHPVVETITASNLSKTCAIFSDYVYYSSIPVGGTTTNNRTITYDRRYQAWSLWTNVSANAFTEYIDSNNEKHLYFAADNDNEVYELDTSYSDNGAAISGQWTSKALNFGDFSLTKQILYIDFEFRQIVGTVGLQVYTDNNTLGVSHSVGSSNDTTGTFGDEMFGEPMWGGSNGAVSSTIVGANTANVPYRLAVNKNTRTVKIKVYNNNVDETFTLLGFKIYYRAYAPEKFDSRYKLSGSGVTTITGGIVTESGDYIIIE